MKNSDKATNIKKVWKTLPAFDIDKRLSAQDEMLEKLLGENETLYLSLCQYEPKVFCVNCGHNVIIKRRLSCFTCSECKGIVL